MHLKCRLENSGHYVSASMCYWDYYNGDLSVRQLTATYFGIGNPLLLNVCIWTLHGNTYPVIVYKETRDITKRLQFAVAPAEISSPCQYCLDNIAA